LDRSGKSTAKNKQSEQAQKFTRAVLEQLRRSKRNLLEPTFRSIEVHTNQPTATFK
jgi:hypothetical protein